MSKFFIKAFSFTEFANTDWLVWKQKKLAEAASAIWEANEESVPYAFGQNISKVPMVWHEDDWKFLSQFPPTFWSRAITWRYNEGLMEASRAREEWYETHGKDRKDPTTWWESLSNTRAGELVFESRGKKYIFKNVWTGY